MSEKEPWYKGWWLIPMIILIGFMAWKLYPYAKLGETIKGMMRKVRG